MTLLSHFNTLLISEKWKIGTTASQRPNFGIVSFVCEFHAREICAATVLQARSAEAGLDSNEASMIFEPPVSLGPPKYTIQ